MSSEHELGLGDLVRLKSGGPIMTASRFQSRVMTASDFQSRPAIAGLVCGYFVGTEYREITVSREALVKVTEEELKQEQEAQKRLGEKPI